MSDQQSSYFTIREAAVLLDIRPKKLRCKTHRAKLGLMVMNKNPTGFFDERYRLLDGDSVRSVHAQLVAFRLRQAHQQETLNQKPKRGQAPPP